MHTFAPFLALGIFAGAIITAVVAGSYLLLEAIEDYRDDQRARAYAEHLARRNNFTRC